MARPPQITKKQQNKTKTQSHFTFNTKKCLDGRKKFRTFSSMGPDFLSAVKSGKYFVCATALVVKTSLRDRRLPTRASSRGVCSSPTKPARLHHVLFLANFLIATMSFMSFLLRVVHWLCAARDVLVSLLGIVKKPLQLTSSKPPHYRAQTDVADLKRVPAHLGIVLVEEDVSYEDVSNLIIWCMLMGITYISIYDRSGQSFIQIVSL